MRRLLTWIVILMTCAIIPLVGIRATHSDSLPTACIQLLSPTTGDVLTLDANSGAALLDARGDYLLPLSMSTGGESALSPDYKHIIDTVDQSTPGRPDYSLRLGRRNTSYRQSLTLHSIATHYVWSPDSQFVAFFSELPTTASESATVNLTIAGVRDSIFKREIIPINLDDYSYFGTHQFVWSPDSSTVALFLNYTSRIDYSTHLMLALRPKDADQAIYVPLIDGYVEDVSWSPTSQVILVFIYNASISAHTLYFISRDGQILNQLPDSAYSPKISYSSDSSAPSYEWSPDGNYFYIADSPYDTHIDIFRLDGTRVLTEPMRILNLPLAWAKLPHTLLYVVGDGDPPSYLYRLDAETGQAQIVLADIDIYPWPDFAVGTQALAVFASSDDIHHIPYVISADLSQIMMPFGESTTSFDSYFIWSPNGQILLMITMPDGIVTLSWWFPDTGEVHQIQLGKQKDFYIDVYWLTDDILLLNRPNDSRNLLWRLDLQSTNLIPLVPKPEHKYSIYKHDDSHLIVSALDSYNIYHLSDGSPVFTNVPHGDGKITPFIEPKERAVLLSHSAVVEVTNSNYRQLTEASLNLVTRDTNLELANTDDLTFPAWSSDGETFAFGVIEPPNAGWTVKIMSRDGTLLHTFTLPPQTAATPYSQIRWTDCH